jgi:hypothetical protein
MPKFGEYTSGGPGQSTDTILVKRGSTTVRTTLDDLPVPASVSGPLNSKVDETTFDATIAGLSADIANGLAGKQDTLTFYGSIQKSGNTVTLDPFTSAGSIIDGKSAYVIPSTTGNNWSYLSNGNSSVTTLGTTTNKGPGSQTDTSYWHTLNRGTIYTAAAAASQARLAFGPRVRFPLSEASTVNSFRFRTLYCITDAQSAASAVGAFQTLPTAGTQPSAYTGSRVYFYFDKGDTTWKFAVNSTIVATIDNTLFPTTGGSTASNPIQFDISVTPAPNWGIYYRMRHLETLAEVSGTYTGAFGGGFNPNFALIRDTIDGTSAVSFDTTGMAFGSFVENVQGESALATPNTITTNTTLTRVPYANVDNFINSATPVTLTIAASGFTPGDYIYGTNRGVGAASFAGNGFSINQHENVTASVEQYQSFSLVCVADGNWIRLS